MVKNDIIKTMKKLIITILTLLLFLLPISPIQATSYDFIIDTDTQISYTTGDNFVTVKYTYKRTVENSNYFYLASGEKVFHIPDIQNKTNDEIKIERKFKKDSILVKDQYGNKIRYSVKEESNPEGMYISIPNYKTTTKDSPYIITFTYKTHDYIQKVKSFVTIQGPALPKDIVLEQVDKSSGTKTKYNYNLNIVTDKDIAPLAKIYPSGFTKKTDSRFTTYSFDQLDRIENSPYLEFGTQAVYKFELLFKTPKTDSFIPEKYSDIYSQLSTNIYEISLPREYGETDQRVYFSSVTPTPKDIYQDTEGNIIGVFEVPANVASEISITGYIFVQQDSFDKPTDSIDMNLTQYFDLVKKSSFLNKYLTASKYWQSTDSYIKQEADRLIANQSTILDIIKADYAFVGDKLEYDYDKANSENQRIGAKAALTGGASVCMEYSDSLIALLRAQGIPARAAGGYANISEAIIDNPTTHQWVQIWIPNYGWLTADPTLESNNMQIGKSIDRILWETFNGDSLSNIRVYTANDTTSFTDGGYNIRVYGVDNADETKLKRYIDLVPEKGYTSTEDIPINSNYSFSHWFNTILKTTMIGKSLLIAGPILIFLVVLTGTILGISFGVKAVKRRKQSTVNTV